MWSSRSSRNVLAEENEYKSESCDLKEDENGNNDMTSNRRVINSRKALSPVGTRMVNAGCISEKPIYNALQDHIRVTCVQKKEAMNVSNYPFLHQLWQWCIQSSTHLYDSKRSISHVTGNKHDTYKPSLEVRGTLNLFMRRRSCSRTVTARSRPL